MVTKNKKELAFRRKLQVMALYNEYRWFVYFNRDDMKDAPSFVNRNEFSMFTGFVKNPKKSPYRKAWGLFRKTYLHKFNYVLTDKWEDLEYKFAYNHFSTPLAWIKDGLPKLFKGNLVYYKPKYTRRTIFELIDIGASNKKWEEFKKWRDSNSNE